MVLFLVESVENILVLSTPEWQPADLHKRYVHEERLKKVVRG